MLRSIQALRRRGSSSSSPIISRSYSSDSSPERKVAVLGAAGGIGQPLALLMKLNPLVSQLSLYDIAGTPGVAADVSHINTRSEVLFHLFSIIIQFSLSLSLWWFCTVMRWFNSIAHFYGFDWSVFTWCNAMHFLISDLPVALDSSWLHFSSSLVRVSAPYLQTSNFQVCFLSS